MRCTACGYENASGRKFCGECGTALKLLKCSSCGGENTPEIKFCGECGRPLAETAKSAPQSDPRSYTPKHLAEKILRSRSALQGERKQVTVLFADLKGSMDLAEQVEAEEWHGIMEGFFRVLSDGVHRFEGTVNQYTGDGIMALFGAPLAHEDHAQRACHAVLHLQQELRRYAEEMRSERGLALSVRMGLNSGEVVVGKIGDDLRMDYTALGHTASLGARMEQIAEPGKVYLSEHTAKLVEGMFTLEDVGRLTVKGAKEPVGVYELLGMGQLRTKLEVSRARGFSRFVGREGEMGVLQSALDKALEGQGQIVAVVGKAGVGKSRLCLEFIERCREKGILVNQGHCLAHGKAIPFAPVLELWRSYFGITEGDPDEKARRKIDSRLKLLGGEDFTEVLPLVFEFLGVADAARPAPQIDPQQKQRRRAQFLRRVVRLQSARAPMVILVDDLHWIDPASDEVVAQLAEAIEGARTMLLVNFRPEYEAPWMKRSHYEQLPLLPLGPEGTEAMLVDLLGSDPSVSELKRRILERTGGNPFFIEEIVQSLAESGALEGARGSRRMLRPLDTVSVPPTVQVVLAARIDRLPDREKALLQTASVIGRVFSEEVVKKVAKLAEADVATALSTLDRRDFVHQESLYPEVEWAFKHPLTQEAAYRSQLSERRKELHGAVARAIQDTYPDKLDERASELAYHWEQAGEALAAARWHRRAAEWLWMRDVARSLEHYGRVRSLTAGFLDEPEARQHRLRALFMLLMAPWRVGLSREEIERLAVEARQIAARQGDARSRLDVETALQSACLMTGQLTEAAEIGEAALRLADELGDVPMGASVRNDLGQTYAYSGRLDAALRILDEALAIYGDDPTIGVESYGTAIQVWTRTVRGLVQVEMGRLASGVADLEVALRRARELRQWEVASWTLVFQVVADEYAGNAVDTELRHARESLEFAERAGAPLSQAWAYHVLGVAHLAAGEPRAALDALERAQALPLPGYWEPLHVAYVAETQLALGDGEAARSAAERAIEQAQETGARLWEQRAHLARARILRALEGAAARDEIEACLGRAETLITETGAHALMPFVIEERARFAMVLGDPRSASRLLQEARHVFEAMGAVGHAARLANELPS